MDYTPSVIFFFFFSKFTSHFATQSPSPCHIQPQPKMMERDWRAGVERAKNFHSHLDCLLRDPFHSHLTCLLRDPSFSQISSNSTISSCFFWLRTGNAFHFLVLIVCECFCTLWWFLYLCLLLCRQLFYYMFFKIPSVWGFSFIPRLWSIHNCICMAKKRTCYQ